MRGWQRTHDGDDANPGTRDAPMANLFLAVLAAAGTPGSADVYVAAGTYTSVVARRRLQHRAADG